MALLAGGQILRVMLCTAMGLAGRRGSAIFTLGPAIPEGVEQKRFREQLRAAVDRLGDSLSGAEWTPPLRHLEAALGARPWERPEKTPACLRPNLAPLRLEISPRLARY